MMLTRLSFLIGGFRHGYSQDARSSLRSQHHRFRRLISEGLERRDLLAGDVCVWDEYVDVSNNDVVSDAAIVDNSITYGPVMSNGASLDNSNYFSELSAEGEDSEVAWAARHNLSSSEFQTASDQFNAAGFRPVDVSGYRNGTSPQYAGIWEMRAGAPWASRHGLTEAQYVADFNNLFALGYRMVDVDAFNVSGTVYFNTIWEQAGGPAWVSYHNMTSAQYQTTFDQLVAQGYRLTRVTGYESAGIPQYAAIWEQTTGPEWFSRHDMTSAQYQAEFNQRLSQGYRLIDISGYDVGATSLFAAIWHRTGGPDWTAQHDMTTTQYVQEFDRLVAQGYRLLKVNGYGSATQPRFAAIWESVTTPLFVGDVNIDGTEDIIKWTNNSWSVVLSPTSGATSTAFATYSSAVGWADQGVGDFNGDGRIDVVARTDTGAWWVGISNGTSFVPAFFGVWSPAVTWDNVFVGDYNNDGRADIAGQTNGAWWVSLSNGTQFTTSLWGVWNSAATFVDYLAKDFTGDGRIDIAARANGIWWVASSTGSSFATTAWATWSNTATFVDVLAGDFNGDGRWDIAGRSSGTWWVAASTGAAFTTTAWGAWSTAVTWTDVQVGKFNAGAAEDIVGRIGGSGTWWLATSTGASFVNSLFTTWAAVQWVDVISGDFNGDGKDDLSGRSNSTLTVTFS